MKKVKIYAEKPSSSKGYTTISSLFSGIQKYINKTSGTWYGSQEEFNQWAKDVVDGAVKNLRIVIEEE